MRHLIKLLFIWCFLTSIHSNAQKVKKDIYFLADTLNIPKEYRLVEIGNSYEVSYTFYCRCLPPTSYDSVYRDLSYTFINTKSVRLAITDKKPDVKYMSWNEFLNLATRPKFFEDNYDFYITEALPNNKFRTNKVKLQRISITQNTQKIKN